AAIASHGANRKAILHDASLHLTTAPPRTSKIASALALTSATRISSTTSTKNRCPFTEEEDRVLKAGYDKTVWTTIVKGPIFQEQSHRSARLHDRFRNAFPNLYQAAGYKPGNSSLALLHVPRPTSTSMRRMRQDLPAASDTTQPKAFYAEEQRASPKSQQLQGGGWFRWRQRRRIRATTPSGWATQSQ
ncbi:hypothetical protein V8E53_015332, partial [Lactarius tabidus]